MHKHHTHESTGLADRRRARVGSQPNAETFNFEIRFLRTAAQLTEILAARRDAYKQHHPDTVDTILGADAPAHKDTQVGSLLLYAIEKSTQRIIGSMRITTNTVRPLQIEQEIEIPEPYAGKHLASFGRLAVLKSKDSIRIKFALIKAAYLYCLANQIQHWFLATIAPIDRLYNRLGFLPVFDSAVNFRLHEANLDLRLMGTSAAQFESYIRANSPVMYRFIFETYHPDIKIFEPISGQWMLPRTTDPSPLDTVENA